MKHAKPHLGLLALATALIFFSTAPRAAAPARFEVSLQRANGVRALQDLDFGRLSALRSGGDRAVEPVLPRVLINNDRLFLALMRAALRAVDTGLHRKRWTREQAVHYLDRNMPSTHYDNQREIDRYSSCRGKRRLTRSAC